MLVTRAKFVCTEVTKSKYWDPTKGEFLYSAKLVPVTYGSEENLKFFEATPSGSISIGTFTDEHFIPGKSYYVDFTEAD